MIDIETGEVENIEGNASAESNIETSPVKNEGPSF